MGRGYERYPRRKRRLTIKAAWFGMWPARRGDLSFWAAVARRIKADRVRSMDRAAILVICAEVERSIPRLGPRAAKSVTGRTAGAGGDGQWTNPTEERTR